MSWFAGGYGSLLLSQYGFTAIDFLSLIPTAFLFFSQAVLSLTKFLLRYLLLYMVGPFLLLIIIVAIKGYFDVLIFPGTYWLASLGFLLWLVGAWLGIKPFQQKEVISKVSILMSYLGVVLIILSLPLPALADQSDQSIPSPSAGVNIIYEIVGLLLLGLLLITPFLIGKAMAETAVRENLLSRVTQLTLNQALPIPGSAPTPEEDTAFRKAFAKPDLYHYTFDEQKPIYLVSCFSQTTILYASTQTTGDERGRLILVATTIICAMEISGSKLNK